MDQEILSEGIFISIAGISIVFTSLIVLLFVFSLLPKILQISTKKRLKREGKLIEENTNLSMSVEVNAAIATALYLYFDEIHDDESREMTIKKIVKTYSPWNSKIYSMNTFKK